MIRIWLQAFRPKTLVAAVVPVLVGTALAKGIHQRWQWWVLVLALLGALLIQIGTNLFNDVLDFKKGADQPGRLGPQRVTQAGLVSPQLVMWAGVLSFALATLVGVPLVWHGGWPIVLIGLSSLICGYAYTGGPFPLAYRGLGELFVVLFFGLVAVGGTYYLHVGKYDVAAVLAGLQVGLLATVLIAINNYRDHVQDRAAEKRTLAVRFGPAFAKREILSLFVMAFSLQWLWLSWFDRPAVALWPCLALPLAIRVVYGIWRNAPGPVYNQYLAQAAGTQILFGGLLSLAWIWL